MAINLNLKLIVATSIIYFRAFLLCYRLANLCIEFIVLVGRIAEKCSTPERVAGVSGSSAGYESECDFAWIQTWCLDRFEKRIAIPRSEDSILFWASRSLRHLWCFIFEHTLLLEPLSLTHSNIPSFTIVNEKRWANANTLIYLSTI